MLSENRQHCQCVHAKMLKYARERGFSQAQELETAQEGLQARTGEKHLSGLEILPE